MRNKIMFVAFIMIAMIALTQIQVSPTLAYEVTEVVLDPVSGSNVDSRTFKSGDYVVADGFATSISMDLPVPLKHTTQTKFGFAVGLGDEAEYHDPNPPYNDWYYTPYVKEMRLKVQGDSYYSVTSLGGITSNTGTGGSSWEFFKYILDAIGYLFTTYGIVNLVSKVYQEPPSEEWQRDEHWAKAIVRQTGNPHEEPRLQTACASLMSYFNREGRNTLTITAEAEIWLRTELHDIVGVSTFHDHVGTYQVSYQVEFDVGLPNSPPNVPELYGPYLYIGGQYVLQSKTYANTEYIFGAYATDPNGDDVQYVFDWGDGTTHTTGWYSGEAHPMVTHSWSSVGTYTVKVKAYDPSGLWSESQPLTVNIEYSTWTCNYCGATYSSQPSYCSYCYNSYSTSYTVSYICNYCGASFSSLPSYCPYCSGYTTVYYYWVTCFGCLTQYKDYHWTGSCDYCGNSGYATIWATLGYEYVYDYHTSFSTSYTYIYTCNYCGKSYTSWNGCYHSSFTPS